MPTPQPQPSLPKVSAPSRPQWLGRTLAAATGLLALDQSVKWLIAAYHVDWHLLDTVGIGIFKNTEGIFSLPTPLVSAVIWNLAAIGLILLFFLLVPRMRSAHLRQGLFLILVGGIANVLDRVTAGAVIDVFWVGTLQFNLADVYIALGAWYVLIQVIWYGKTNKKLPLSGAQSQAPTTC